MKNQQAKNKPAVSSIPEGFNSVNSFLIVEGAERLISFLENGLGGKLTSITRDNTENNRIMHATVRIGNSTIMIGDAMGSMREETAMIFLYVDNVDELYDRAIAANGQSIQEPKDEFYGDRVGGVKDEFGNTWWIATHIEDVGKEELRRRADEANTQRKKEKEHA